MSFKDELNRQSKTPEDVIYESARTCASLDHYNIKRQLLLMAEGGQYTYVNGKRKIVYYYTKSHVNSYFDQSVSDIAVNKTLFNRGGQHAYRSYFYLKNKTGFDMYINTLKKMAEADDIRISVVAYYYHPDPKQCEEYAIFNVHYDTFYNPRYWLSPCLKCEVEY